jgi:hypothetical protein
MLSMIVAIVPARTPQVMQKLKKDFERIIMKGRSRGREEGEERGQKRRGETFVATWSKLKGNGGDRCVFYCKNSSSSLEFISRLKINGPRGPFVQLGAGAGEL